MGKRVGEVRGKLQGKRGFLLFILGFLWPKRLTLFGAVSLSPEGLCPGDHRGTGLWLLK